MSITVYNYPLCLCSFGVRKHDLRHGTAPCAAICLFVCVSFRVAPCILHHTIPYHLYYLRIHHGLLMLHQFFFVPRPSQSTQSLRFLRSNPGGGFLQLGRRRCNSPGESIFQAVSQLDHSSFPLVQVVEHILQILVEQRPVDTPFRRHVLLVQVVEITVGGHHVTDGVVPLVAVVLGILLVLRRLERNRPFCQLDHALVLRGGHVEGVRHFFIGRRSSHTLLEAASYFSNPVHHVVDVNGKANGSRVVGNRSEDRLLNPPRGIGREFEALGGIEFFGRPGQSQASFLYQVLQTHSHLGVLLGNRNDQPHVGLYHEPLGPASP
mmetsp:Transcript_19548/g.42520  ORF Transcript_19548/g.42520 Transcript_19548/m.42520 type:complete len:322 (+) Transcript_19548:62-1027(+)